MGNITIPLIDELHQQPAALRSMVEFYQQNVGLLDLGSKFRERKILLTGMGASYHAALIASIHMNRLGISSTAVEAADLLNFGMRALEQDPLLIYISQSGASGEVRPLLERFRPVVSLVSVTNNPRSPLAMGADLNLPMMAGEEHLIASKTYLNTLAILWVLARKMAGASDGSEFESLRSMAGRVEQQLENTEPARNKLLTKLDGCKPLIFLGYGPHAITARQAAMVLSEWAKVPVLHYSAGAFRHGYIEIVEDGCGVVIISPAGDTPDKVSLFAEELQKYGARVVIVDSGIVSEPGEINGTSSPIDEFLSPLVDIIPFQLYAEALARQRGYGKGFRYINKVVTKL